MGSMQELVWSYNLRHQSQRQRFLSVEDASSQQKIAPPFLADVSDQKAGNNRGHKANADFGISKLRFRHRQSKVAERSQPSAAGNRGAVDGRNRRLGKIVERAEQAGHGLRISYVLFVRASGKLLQVFEVHASAESRARSSQNDNLRAGFFCLLQRREQAINQFVAD